MTRLADNKNQRMLTPNNGITLLLYTKSHLQKSLVFNACSHHLHFLHRRSTKLDFLLSSLYVTHTLIYQKIQQLEILFSIQPDNEVVLERIMRRVQRERYLRLSAVILLLRTSALLGRKLYIYRPLGFRFFFPVLLQQSNNSMH